MTKAKAPAKAKAKADWVDLGTIEKILDLNSEMYIIYASCKRMFPLLKKFSFIPKEGDSVACRGTLGGLEYGLKIRGQVVYDPTDEELEAERKKALEEHRMKQKAEFEKNRAKHDAEYDSLPPIFKKRIDRLRKNNPDFRWSVEAYDIFACKEGIKIASKIKTLKDLKRFVDLGFEDQLKVVDLDPGHSGGTFGQAKQIASCLIIGKEKYIPFIHSSLSVVSGCEVVGCTPPTEAERQEYGLSKTDWD